MKSHKDLSKTIISERMMIFEMIDAACELAAKKGKHPLERGCNCISCVNKRKCLFEKPKKNWDFSM